MSNVKVKAYFVTNCKVSATELWSGYVLNANDEPIVNSIKRKLGKEALLCELTNEGFDYDKVNVYSIPLHELSLGDMLVMTGNMAILNS